MSKWITPPVEYRLPRRMPPVQGLLDARNITVFKGERLKLKLLIFDSRRNMAAWWKSFWPFGSDNRGCSGFVNPLIFDSIICEKGKPDKKVPHGDPNFFAVMCLVKKEICDEIIVHESVHAGFCWARRCKGPKFMWATLNRFDEEKVAYPAGIIACYVKNTLTQIEKSRPGCP